MAQAGKTYLAMQHAADARTPAFMCFDENWIPLVDAAVSLRIVRACWLLAACPCGGIGRRVGLKIRFREECQFESDQGHQLFQHPAYL